MAQRLDPDGDISVGTFTTTPLWSKLNDGDSPNDGTFIISPNNGATTSFEVSLTNPGLTPSPGDTVITVRLKSTRTDGQATLELYEGATQRGSLSVTPSGALINYSFTVSSGIGNFDNLSVRVTKETNDLPEQYTVSHIKVEVPGVTVQKTITGKASIVVTSTKTITAKGAVMKKKNREITGAAMIVYESGNGFRSGTTFDFENYLDGGVAWIGIDHVAFDDSSYATVNVGDL